MFRLATQHTREPQSTSWVLKITMVEPAWDMSPWILKDQLAVSHAVELKQHVFSEFCEMRLIHVGTLIGGDWYLLFHVQWIHI